ncbi:site-specific integrase [Flavobacterium agricola]|uniref:Site-specific integrase n=1 Tax=Flavobacterium agricola TaxID=2870839 RepID=A0ABY6M1E9_9FLAO|nr:site-specific integrase [Flavobacterium agricola]UYW02392.1 site-specific integrase [Flavobacterium agricola]
MKLNRNIFKTELGQHKNQRVIWIDFPYAAQHVADLREALPHVKWSSSQKKWYIIDKPIFRDFFNISNETYEGKNLLVKIDVINKPELQKFIQQLRLKAYSESTIKTYSAEFAQFLYILNKHDVKNISSEQLRSYLLYCITELKLSENQIHSRLNALKFYFEQVLHRENLFFEIPRPKKQNALPKVLSQAEIKRLFTVTNNVKHQLILKVAYGLGLRVSEIVALELTDIDSDRMLVHIKNAKGKKDRYVPLPQVLLTELRNYYKTYKPKKYLFEGQYNQPYATRSAQAVFKTAMKKARINKPIGIHGLRHSYATHLLEYGTDMSFIQKLLGHNQIKTTQVYAKVTNTFLAKVISPLDRLNQE